MHNVDNTKLKCTCITGYDIEITTQLKSGVYSVFTIIFSKKTIFVPPILKSYTIVMIKVCVLNTKETKIEILKLFK